MNKKEISELRRRFSPDKNSIGHIYGCYVNTKKEIIAYLDESLAAMPPEEAEKYLGLLKKALSGTQGKNLIDIVFSTQQVADSPEHKLLMSLRETELKDPAVRQAFYDKVIESLDMDDSNYLVLLAHDAYDVPFKAKDGLTFDHKPDQIHQEFIDGVFRVEPPMSAAEQRETFETILSESLGDACTLQLARNLYEWVRDKVEEHKESREEEPLAVTAADLTAVLLDSQVPEAQVQAFAARFAESFGASAAMNPANLINTGKFELEAGDGAAKVTLAPEQGGRIETTEIDGRKYLLIPAEGLYANGLPVQA